MEIDKNKKQKKLERMFMIPNYTPVLALTVKNDTDIEDEEIVEDERGKKTVKQKIKGTKFITETEMETVINNGIKMKEKSLLELDLAEGTRLIWLEGKGYILPSEQFGTIEEIEENYNYLKE